MEVNKITVVGAGTMGNQISQLAAQSGYQVSLVGNKKEFFSHSLNVIRGSLKKFFVDRDKITQDEADSVLAKISGTTDLKAAVAGAQVVIEAIPEEMKLKQELFKKLDELCAPETILASNTSSLMISEIGALTKRPDKVIGMHLWNPVMVMKLAEIIRGVKTSDETYQVIKELASRFGKESITARDSPGFVVGRLFAVFCTEAAKILQEGIATAEDIDKGCELGLGHPMGPFKTQDMTNGVGVTVHVMNCMRDHFGDAYLPALLQSKMLLAGEIGVKAGKGFYQHKKR